LTSYWRNPAVAQQQQVFPEYLGDIDSEALLQNLKNVNSYFNSIDNIRRDVPKGFEVMAEITEDKELVRLVLKPITSRRSLWK
jgi:hypothetical protein